MPRSAVDAAKRRTADPSFHDPNDRERSVANDNDHQKSRRGPDDMPMLTQERADLAALRARVEAADDAAQQRRAADGVREQRAYDTEAAVRMTDFLREKVANAQRPADQAKQRQDFLRGELGGQSLSDTLADAPISFGDVRNDRVQRALLDAGFDETSTTDDLIRLVNADDFNPDSLVGVFALQTLRNDLKSPGESDIAADGLYGPNTAAALASLIPSLAERERVQGDRTALLQAAQSAIKATLSQSVQVPRARVSYEERDAA